MSAITLDTNRVLDSKLENLSQPILHSGERCDRCGAQAYVRHTLESGNELQWCLHHAKMYRPIMEAQGVLWKAYTEEARLVEDRKKGSEN